MLLALLYLFSIALCSWYRPMWALALAANAFLVNASIGGDGGATFIMVGLGGPLLCFSVILIKRFLQGKSFYMPVGLDGLMVFSLFWCLLVSAAYARDSFLSLDVAFRYLILCASFFFIIKFVICGSKNWSDSILSFAKATMIIGFLAAIYAILKGDSSSQYVTRLTIGTASSIPLSILVAQSIIIAFYCLIVEKGLKFKVLYSIMLIVLLYAEILTNTRSALIGIFLALVVILIFSSKKLGIGFYFKLILLSAVLTRIFMVLIAGNEELYERAFSGFERLLSGQFGESEGDRVLAWGYALNAFSENFWGGIGAGNFGQYYIAYPHNIFFELLAENGILGFLTFFILCSWMVFCACRGVPGVLVLVLSLVVFQLFVAQVSLTLWMHKSLFIWLALFFSGNYKMFGRKSV